VNIYHFIIAESTLLSYFVHVLLITGSSKLQDLSVQGIKDCCTQLYFTQRYDKTS